MKLLGVFAVVVLALVSVACTSTTAAADLKVGDCFNNTYGTDANGDSVVNNSVVDCAQAHDAEVFLVFVVPPGPNGYPGDEAIGTLQQSRCDAAFTTYVGKDSGLSSYTIDYLRPDINSWASGDRTIDCLIEDGNGGQLTGSAKGTKK